MRIALFGNTYRERSLEQIKTLLSVLQNKEVDLIADKAFYLFATCQIENSASLIKEVIEPGDEINADFALSVGGDGTFLNTAYRIGNKGIPILGINAGSLGFLTDVAGDDIEHAIDDLLQHKFVIEERSVIELRTSSERNVLFALNEIAVLKQDSSSMIGINAVVNGEFLNTYLADGLIVATPTGSTAYSLSVGGPLVVPQSNNLILSPVAPHSLNIRPLIIPDSWTIELSIKSRNSNFLVAVDGRSEVFDHSEKLFISKGDYTIKVIKREKHTFFNTLRTKLMWGIDKRS